MAAEAARELNPKNNFREYTAVSEMDAIIKEFLVEGNENLDQLDRDLVELEKNPTSRDKLASIFRMVHTIKGGTGLLGFSKLGTVSHAGEGLLSRLRDGDLVLNPEIASGLFALVDAARHMLFSIESTGGEGEEDYASLVERLKKLQASEPASKRTPDRIASPESKAPVTAVVAAPNVPRNSEEVAPIGEILIRDGLAEQRQIAAASQQQLQGDPRHMGEILVEQGVIRPATVLDALKGQKEFRSPALSSGNIRVDVRQLDKLMNLVGELVLSRNHILQLSAAQHDDFLFGASQRLDLITSELQEGVMKTRMQPIENIWNKLPRIVRDLALCCGKQLRVEMDGKETELDKTIIEAIKDPLTHLVRNSIDHGIETPDARVSAGKPAEGRICLRAFHEGGKVNIEIADDGSGIDLERVKRKAIERGLITPEQATHTTEREAVRLVFLPGFSTTEKVTNVSGRGVGLDVVKTNIEKIGGTVDLQTKPGQGTTVKMKIPLTLAIIPALVVTCVDHRYAIPQVSVLELVRLEGEDLEKGIELIHGAPVHRLRENLLPLVYLNRELKVGPASSVGARKAKEDEVANIIVLQADDRQFGLVVDGVNDTEEIVVKPLGQQLKGIPVFAGATIMGDGKIALILDVVGLAQRASVISEVRDRKLAPREALTQEHPENRQSLLLFRGPDDARMAIPLALVTRLEEFSRSSIQKTGGREVVQYRGEILPLVYVSRLLSERRRRARSLAPKNATEEKIQIVVFSLDGCSVGLVVDRILDILEETLTFQYPSSRRGTLGSAVIQGRVTEILDIDAITSAMDSNSFRKPATVQPKV